MPNPGRITKAVWKITDFLRFITCTYACTACTAYTCMFEDLHTHTDIHTVHTFARTHTDIIIRIYIYIYMHIYLYIYTYIHTHIYIYIYTGLYNIHIHDFICLPSIFAPFVFPSKSNAEDPAAPSRRSGAFVQGWGWVGSVDQWISG